MLEYDYLKSIRTVHKNEKKLISEVERETNNLSGNEKKNAQSYH